MPGTGSETLPWVLLLYVLLAVFTAKAQRTTGYYPAVGERAPSSSTREREGLWVAAVLLSVHMNQVTV